eukprot:g34479.t1
MQAEGGLSFLRPDRVFILDNPIFAGTFVKGLVPMGNPICPKCPGVAVLNNDPVDGVRPLINSCPNIPYVCPQCGSGFTERWFFPGEINVDGIYGPRSNILTRDDIP